MTIDLMTGKLLTLRDIIGTDRTAKGLTSHIARYYVCMEAPLSEIGLREWEAEETNCLQHLTDRRIEERKEDAGQDKFRADQHEERADFVPDNLPVNHQRAIEGKDILLLRDIPMFYKRSGKAFMETKHFQHICEDRKVMEIGRTGGKRYCQG